MTEKTLEEKLAAANKRIDDNIDRIWKQAEENLKQLENDYLNHKNEKDRD